MLKKLYYLFYLFFLILLIDCSKGSKIKNVLISENPELSKYLNEKKIEEWSFENFVFKRKIENNSIQYSIESKKYNKTIWQTPKNEGFLAFASGKEDVQESRGSFFIQEKIKLECKEQVIDNIEQEKHFVAIKGHNICDDKSHISYAVYFYHESPEKLKIAVFNYDQRINRIYLSFLSDPKEAFFGFGEQFTYFNLKGKRLPIFVMEQGIGRGEEPITTGANLTAKSGGDWYTSYAPIPYFISSRLRSFFLENTEYSVFDLTEPNKIQIEVFSNQLKGNLLVGDSPSSLIQTYTQYSGRMIPLPDWIHKGAIVGMQGGTEEVYKKWEMLKKYQTPISAFWLQDWVGQRKTSFGKQLWWNWELDEDRYPNWNQLVKDLKKENINVMIYISPFLADIKALKPNIKKSYYDEAKEKGYLVRKPDGSPYLVKNTDFYAALVDLTNPNARQWYKNIIKQNLLGVGAMGWMADFGEALPYDAVLFNGDPKGFHNQYPVEWAKLNYEAVTEANQKEVVYFLRAGFTQSPKYATLFWLGDQLVSWSEYDGIKTAVTGLLSSGLSGYVYNHSDIGGYTTITHWLKNYHRSKELFLRWTELSAFTAIFRTHEGNQPENNHQFYSDEETLQFFARFAKIYAHLFSYRKDLIKQAKEFGYPLVRPLFFHYPDDEKTYNINYEEFLLGPDLLVAPVLDPNTQKKEVYLPQGTWVELWTNQTYEGNNKIVVDAPLGKPPLFYKKDSSYKELFEKIRNIQ